MQIHVIPDADEREHELTPTCWCEPRVDWLDPDTNLPWASGYGPRVIHSAADCRECAEEIDGKCMAPGKTWSIVNEEGEFIEQA